MTTQLCDAPVGATLPAHDAERQPAHWSGVFAMTLCVFALIASEFMPVSLLTAQSAADLHVTEGLAGQGIAISGSFAVVTSLFISTLAGSMNRKTLLLGLTALMAALTRQDPWPDGYEISGLISVVSANYNILFLRYG